MSKFALLSPSLLREAAKQLASHEWQNGTYFKFRDGDKLYPPIWEPPLTSLQIMMDGVEPCKMCASGAIFYAFHLLYPEKELPDEGDLLVECGQLISELSEYRVRSLIGYNDIIANSKEEVVGTLLNMADYLEKESK